MDITYYIEADFECAFLINGLFRERAGLLDYPDTSPLYITALPLRATLHTYTIKITNGVVHDNENLVDIYRIDSHRVAVKLKERHNYVYSPIHAVNTSPNRSAPYELFRLIKLGKLDQARMQLTDALSRSIDDDSLVGFFQPFVSIFACMFPDINASYLLIADNNCEAYNFTFSGNLIDNIEQVEF